MESQFLPAEMSRELMPVALQNDDYYVGNDEYVVREMQVREEIIALAESMEPWEGKLAKLYASGKSLREIGKTLKKRPSDLAKAVKQLSILRLVHYWQALEVLRDGPNEILRKHMLWRIAKDNEKPDPKEAIKAVAELNKMAAPKGGGSGTFNIIINNAVLPRGPLDG